MPAVRKQAACNPDHAELLFNLQKIRYACNTPVYNLLLHQTVYRYTIRVIRQLLSTWNNPEFMDVFALFATKCFNIKLGEITLKFTLLHSI